MAGGGTSLDVLNRISLIENELEILKNSIATSDTYGLVKTTNNTDITQNNGFAISAMQNNALIDGSLRNRIEQVDGKFKRMLLYQNDSAIKENEILNLSSDDYQILEIHCGFEANIKRACFALKGNNIVLDYVGVGRGADALSFTASRPYLFQSATAYKAGIAVLRRFSGNYEKSYAWLNISAIYGLKFN